MIKLVFMLSDAKTITINKYCWKKIYILSTTEKIQARQTSAYFKTKGASSAISPNLVDLISLTYLYTNNHQQEPLSVSHHVY